MTANPVPAATLDNASTNAFSTLGILPALAQNLDSINFKTPTPIQSQAIPAIIEGQDILGSAQTGTGKTGAFGIPLVNYLIQNPTATALVLTPTRELATQVITQLKQFMPPNVAVKSALLIGGDPMFKQLKQLRSKARLIVGTPGRVNDHLKRATLDLSQAQYVVLDETDRMLDMGFSIQIEAIAKYLPAERQTLLFSATLPKSIMSLANRYLNNPKRIDIAPKACVTEHIPQHSIHLDEAEKYHTLKKTLKDKEGTAVLFVKTKHNTEKLAKRLSDDGISAEAIHGDLRQRQRENTLKAFRQERYRVLVATDVAARGLDVPHIAQVINYDLPQCAEDYVHRIGRTARAGAKGEAINLISPQDRRKWRAIEQLLNPKAAKSHYSENDDSSAKRPARGRRKPSGFKPSFKKTGDKSFANRAGAFTKDSSSKKRSFQDKPAFAKPRRDKKKRFA